jgi:uncharacterized protein (TIGR02284 family)
MAIRTQLDLSPEAIERLQELVQINIDSRDGFEYAAERIENMSIAGFFQQMAMERRAQAEELSRFVEFNGEEADRTGSFSAAVHRSWLALRDSLSGSSPYAVLAEAERGEDAIKEAYEEALRAGWSGDLHDILTRQYTSVRAAHDRVRELRDAHDED